MSAKIISVLSSKGGVGKTFISVNIATALALSKKKVLVVDFDLQAGQDMARMLKLLPLSSIAELFPQVDHINDPGILKEHLVVHSSGLHFISAIRTTQQLKHITADSVKEFFLKIIDQYDFIVVDAGRSFSETLISVLDLSNLLLLIATPDILAVYQIRWCLDVLHNLHFPSKMVKLILNRSESRGGVAWQEVRSALTCEIIGHIPSDGKVVGLALNRGVPCVIDSPRSRVSESFARLVATLKKEAIYVPASITDKKREANRDDKVIEFWEKFGIKTQVSDSVIHKEAFFKEMEERKILKKKVHEKLVERLNVDGITPDTLSDPQAAAAVKKKAETVVGNLLLEEVGGMISSHDERIRLVKDIVNEALGLGPLEDFLADPEVTDIMVNSRDQIYIEKAGKLMLTNKTFLSDDKMRSIIDRIIAPLGRRIDESTPMVDARLPDGSRINAIIPPLSLGGPMITIRKFGQERIGIKEMLQRYHSLTDEMADFLRKCVAARKNIIVSGGTGAGKTTLLNIISEFIPDGERIITIEDAAELRLKKSHWARLESRPQNVEGKGQVTIRDLFVNCLRMRPDRIVIGECRGGEVLDMLQAMNTGHDGSLTTLHANSTRDALTRLHSLILLSGVELPVRSINEMIASAIDLLVHINRFSDGTRKITGISEVCGLDKEFSVQLEDIFVFDQKGISEEGKIIGQYTPTGYIPSFYDEFVLRGMKIDKATFTPKNLHENKESNKE